MSFDLAGASGSARFRMVPGGAPRHSKAQRELYVVKAFLPVLAAHERFTASGIRSNSFDPPDVLFEKNGLVHGIELGELVPVNRLEKDSVLGEIRRSVLRTLRLGDRTRNKVVTIVLEDDHARKLHLRGLETAMTAVLDQHFSVRHDVSTSAYLSVPPELEGVVRAIFVAPQDLTGDPRVSQESEPLLIFSAQHTLVTPDEDFPVIIDRTFARKALHSLSMPSWLVLWAEHRALVSLKEAIVEHIDAYHQSHRSPYERIFYFHMFPGDGLTEIRRDNLDVDSTSHRA